MPSWDFEKDKFTVNSPVLTRVYKREAPTGTCTKQYIKPNHISQGFPTWKFKTKQTLVCVLLCWCWILQLSRCSLLDRRSPPSFFRVPKEKILLPPIAQIFKTTLFMRAKTMQNPIHTVDYHKIWKNLKDETLWKEGTV